MAQTQTEAKTYNFDELTFGDLVEMADIVKDYDEDNRLRIAVENSLYNYLAAKLNK